MIENVQVGDDVKLLHVSKVGIYPFCRVIQMQDGQGVCIYDGRELKFSERDVFECRRPRIKQEDAL